jgi:hypothetical protein
MEDLDARFEAASSKTNASFLDVLNTNRCLESCSAAKSCWDAQPVCRLATSACDSNQECCEFTTGKGACDADTKACCKPRSVPCDPNDLEGNPCCDALPCVQISDVVFTCGGDAPCIDLEQPCESDAACCSNFCKKDGDAAVGTCAQKTCGDIQVGCDTKADCCGDLCCSGVDGCEGVLDSPPGVCVQPTCADEIDPCAKPVPCDPAGDPSKQCCGDPAAICVTPVGGDGPSVCAHIGSPLPPGFDCSADTGCCGVDGMNQGVCGATGICQVSASTCTSYDPSAYLQGSQPNCGDPMLPECCGGCFGGRCACGLSACHSPTLIGSPIGCLAGETNAEGREACALRVCETQPACCCLAWEEECLIAAYKTCADTELQ